MSWLSKTVNKARNFTNKAAVNLGMNETQQKYFRYGVSTMGGGMGIQYEYSRNKGMNSDEAVKNSTTGGAQYSEARGMQKARGAAEDAAAQAAEMSRQQAAQEIADRNAQGVLIRRRRNRADPTKGGTLLTGALGLAGNTGTRLGVV